MHTVDPVSPQADPAVMRFFPAVLPIPLDEALGQARDYFFSVYENTLRELLGFVLLALAAMIGRHIWLNRRIRKWRQSWRCAA